MQVFGVNAPSYASYTLLAYLLIYLPAMLLGFYFARRKQFNPQHKYIMTAVVIANWLLILAVMIGSYGRNVAPSLGVSLGEPYIWLPTLHLLTGTIAQIMGTYLVLLMWTEHTRFEKALPWRIKNIKTPMRITLTLWIATIGLGLALYLAWYGATPATAGDSIIPAVTEEAPLSVEASPLSTEEAPSIADEAPLSTEEAPLSTEEAPLSTEEAPDDDATDDQDDS